MTPTDHTHQPPNSGPIHLSHGGNEAVADFLAEDAENTTNPIAIIMRLLRGRFLVSFIVAVFVAVVLALTVFKMLKPTYLSEGLVRIIAREPRILTASRDDSRLRLFDAFSESEARYLQSPEVMGLAFGFVANDPDAADHKPIAFKEFQDGFSVTRRKGLIAIQNVSPEPQKAARQVNALLDAYSIQSDQQSIKFNDLRTRELSKRLEDLVAKQRGLDNRLLEIGGEYDQYSLAKAHLTKIMELEEVEKRLSELVTSIAQLETQQMAVDADTGDMEIKRATLLDRAMADMVFERAKRAAELKALSLRYREDHPEYQKLASALDVIDKAIETRRLLIATLGKTGAITGGDAQSQEQSIEELRALEEKLRLRREELSESAIILNGKLIEITRLNAERTQVSDMIKETRRILDETRIESRNNMPGVAEILSRGTVPLAPFNDKRKPMAAIAGVMGGGFILVCTLLIGLISGRARFSDDVEAAIGDAPFVFPENASGDHYRRFITSLQFRPEWRMDIGNVVCLFRASSDIALPISSLLDAASDQGLSVLTLFATPEARTGQKGVQEWIANTHNLPLSKAALMPYGQRQTPMRPADLAACLNDARTQFDIVLVDIGSSDHSEAAQLFPNFADLTISVFAPRSPFAAVKRLAAKCRNHATLFLNAKASDPGFISSDHQTNSQEGGFYEHAA